MSNVSIVSSVKGTILNYFGLGDSYNPFTNKNALQVVTNLDFEIPAVEPFVNAGYVAVSTGLLTTSLSFLNDGNLAIYDTDRTTKIADLTNVIGELGNDKYMPKENQVFWFNKDGLRGTYFLNSAYAGKILRIISGRYVTTSITAGVLNEMFARTTGVPAYIEEINNSISDIKKYLSEIKPVVDKLESQSTSVRTFSGRNKPNLEAYFTSVEAYFCYLTYTIRTGESSQGTPFYTTYNIFKAASGFSLPNPSGGVYMPFNVDYQVLAIGKLK